MISHGLPIPARRRLRSHRGISRRARGYARRPGTFRLSAAATPSPEPLSSGGKGFLTNSLRPPLCCKRGRKAAFPAPEANKLVQSHLQRSAATKRQQPFTPYTQGELYRGAALANLSGAGALGRTPARRQGRRYTAPCPRRRGPLSPAPTDRKGCYGTQAPRAAPAAART